jgi:gas vesicle protein
MSKNHHSNLILGLLIGLVGALFFAPQKGKMVRERIAKARENGENGIEPLKKGFLDLFREMARNVKMHSKSKTGHNPFTITNIY